MVKKIGWYNKNKTGNSVRQESHRHSLASRGIKTSAPKGSRVLSSGGSPTPNFDMVKKGKNKVTKGTLVNYIMDYEQGELTDADTIELFSYLLKTKMVWSLQGHYGRTATRFIEAGYLSNEGNILKKTDMIIGKGIDFPMKEFHKGIKVETEHSKTVKGDPITIARIALDHLEEDKDYYTKLAVMERHTTKSSFDMRTDEVGDLFFRGATKGKTPNLKIVDKGDKTQLVGYDWAVYGERDKKTGKVTYYKGWYGYSPTTSKQLGQTGLKYKADKVVEKRKEVLDDTRKALGFDMSLTDLSKKLKKASKDVSEKAHDISKKIEKRNIERQEKAEKKIAHDLEVAKQQLKLKKLQAKADLVTLQHTESVQRQRQELARINKELEKGTTKAKAKELSKKAGKEGLKLAGILAKGVAREVKEAISTEPPKKKRR